MNVKKVAVMVPIYLEGGTLRMAKNFAKMVFTEAKKNRDNIQVVFGNPGYPESSLNDLIEMGIEVRPLTLKQISFKKASELAKSIPGNFHLIRKQEYCIPSDGDTGFLDCDSWIFISDRFNGILIPLRKTGIVVTDYIQRYVPQIVYMYEFEGKQNSMTTLIRNTRNSDFVFASTPGTFEDIKSYVGRKDGVYFLDPVFEPGFLQTSNRVGKISSFDLPYFMWVTNASIHKNHMRALEALEIYYTKLNGLLKCVVTGSNTKFFDPDTPKFKTWGYNSEVRDRIVKSSLLTNNIVFPGNVSDEKYFQLLKGARFLWHNVIADNGTYSVVEAAYCGIPSLSSDYPQQRYLDTQFKLNMEFFDPFSPEETAEKLKVMEQGRDTAVDSHFLTNHTWQALAPKHYGIVRECLEKPREARNLYS
jgi:glycosyltransferase involved in cell wall biosynthesis